MGTYLLRVSAFGLPTRDPPVDPPAASVSTVSSAVRGARAGQGRVKGEMQNNTTAINNIDNSSRTNAVGGRRGVSNEDVSQKNHKVRYAN